MQFLAANPMFSGPFDEQFSRLQGFRDQGDSFPKLFDVFESDFSAHAQTIVLYRPCRHDEVFTKNLSSEKEIHPITGSLPKQAKCPV